MVHVLLLRDDVIVMCIRFAVYGAGWYGHDMTYFIDGIKGGSVTCVCDRDEKKWGTKCGPCTVIPSTELYKKTGDIDAVFIAIKNEDKYIIKNKVAESIFNGRDDNIYFEANEVAADQEWWDISGICNAKCRYCATGKKNRIFKNNSGREKLYMTHVEFVRYYEHLLDFGIISKRSKLALYNWYEPYMNPEMMHILNYLSDNNQNYELSTNASIFRPATKDNTYSECSKIIFSVPGYEQKSYERIHYSQFSADGVRRNIEKFINDMSCHGFRGCFEVAFHKYRFNKEEREKLIKWAREKGLMVRMYGAYLNGNSFAEDYFAQRYTKDEFEALRNDLCIDWDVYNRDRPEGDYSWICNNLCIDVNGNRTLCNYADEFRDDYDIWGSVMDIDSYRDVVAQKDRMLNSNSCKLCCKFQISYRILDFVVNTEET